MSDDRKAKIVAALRAEDVAAHYQIAGVWRGRWMRSRRCPQADHGTDACGISRDGRWHCHACDTGGDLLKLIALAEGWNITAEFPRVLELAAAIAGVVEADDFGGGEKPPPPKRPPPPPISPLADRLELAHRRARFVWARLVTGSKLPAGWLEHERGLPPAAVLAREELRTTPIRITPDELAAAKDGDLAKLAAMFRDAAIAIPVRAVADGQMVDVRVRRLEPRADQPKIVGMVGGLVRSGEDLIGCYGRPHELERDMIVVVEGIGDYLTALAVWPEADVLGAVDAGSFALVAAHAADQLAARGDGGRLLLVEQQDEPGKGSDVLTSSLDKQGRPRDGAAERAMLAACKRAIAIAGPRRVGWLFCDPHKDLNDLVRAGAPITPRWWSMVGDGVAA